MTLDYNLFNGIKKFVLDTLFPISCLSCDFPGVFLCDTCLLKIKILSKQVCPYCESAVTPAGKICLPCKIKYLSLNKSAPLDGLIVSAHYKNIARPVHIYKYNFASGLAIPLAKIMERASLKHELELPDFIVPVPLHPRRERWRGFNQARLLAESLGKNLSPGFSIPVFDLAARKRFTAPQMEIKNQEERKKNIQSAFMVNPEYKSKLVKKKILLVDDICTTGSTLFECARVLKLAGAASVWGIVLARQEFNKNLKH